MTDKVKIYGACIELLNEKIAIAQKGMDEAQASANNETKSSAGDKYETGRAMSQRERDLHARQLAELINMQKAFNAIDPEKSSSSVELGALVNTSNAQYFIAASLGALKLGDHQVMVISAISPIAQAMLDKKAGDTFKWMNDNEKIISVQ